MARVEVADLLLLGAGVPDRVDVALLDLVAPAGAARVEVADLTLFAPAFNQPSSAVTLRGRARWQVIAGPYNSTVNRPIVMTGAWRVLTAVPKVAQPVMRGRLRWQVNAAQQIAATSTPVRVRSTPRWAVLAVRPVPVTVVTSLRVPGPLHLAWPARVARDGSLTSLLQDSPAEVLQTASVLAATSPGSRPARPEFGMRDSTFDTALTPAEVESAVTFWDDRVEDVTTDTTGKGDTRLVTVRVRQGEDA